MTALNKHLTHMCNPGGPLEKHTPAADREITLKAKCEDLNLSLNPPHKVTNIFTCSLLALISLPFSNCSLIRSVFLYKGLVALAQVIQCVFLRCDIHLPKRPQEIRVFSDHLSRRKPIKCASCINSFSHVNDRPPMENKKPQSPAMLHTL